MCGWQWLDYVDREVWSWVDCGLEVRWHDLVQVNAKTKWSGWFLYLYFVVFLFFLFVISVVLFEYCVVYFMVPLVCQSRKDWCHAQKQPHFLGLFRSSNPQHFLHSMSGAATAAYTICTAICVIIRGTMTQSPDYHWTSTVSSSIQNHSFHHMKRNTLTSDYRTSHQNIIRIQCVITHNTCKNVYNRTLHTDSIIPSHFCYLVEITRWLSLTFPVYIKIGVAIYDVTLVWHSVWLITLSYSTSPCPNPIHPLHLLQSTNHYINPRINRRVINSIYNKIFPSLFSFPLFSFLPSSSIKPIPHLFPQSLHRNGSEIIPKNGTCKFGKKKYLWKKFRKFQIIFGFYFFFRVWFHFLKMVTDVKVVVTGMFVWCLCGVLVWVKWSVDLFAFWSGMFVKCLFWVGRCVLRWFVRL